ncbi:MAG: DUF817 family protein [Pseudomonadota bacterium]|nr:DUF817 family protein [Pseudomonadota bacterium]
MLRPLVWFLMQSSAAALFGILLLVAFVATAALQWPILDWYRYDFLLLYALLIQFFLIYFKLESWREVSVIAIFHLLAMFMELFLTAPQIGSWHYPEPAVLKIATVPLFAGFMYSAVGSFLARSLRLFSVSFEGLPSLRWLGVLAVLCYLNFFTKYVLPDIRLGLFVASVFLFYRTRMHFNWAGHRMQMWFLPCLLGLAGLVWIAENIATYTNIWLYPSQVEQWHWVGLGKVGSWYLLLLLSIVLVLSVMGKRSPDGRWRLHSS